MIESKDHTQKICDLIKDLIEGGPRLVCVWGTTAEKRAEEIRACAEFIPNLAGKTIQVTFDNSYDKEKNPKMTMALFEIKVNDT
jgi:hypothetical protein